MPCLKALATIIPSHILFLCLQHLCLIDLHNIYKAIVIFSQPALLLFYLSNAGHSSQYLFFYSQLSN